MSRWPFVFQLCCMGFILAGCTSSPTPTKKGPPPSSTADTEQRTGGASVIHTLAPRKAAGEECIDCHPVVVENYRKTGMGRSLSSVKDAPIIENFDEKHALKKHPKLNAVYRAFIDKNGRWWQEESIPGTKYRRAVEVKYIIGSGNHTRSYLGVVNDQLVELPLTWYTGRKLWDMSPGYEGLGHFRFFRTVTPECLFCHNALTPHRKDSEASYEWPLHTGIGCERCHGNGDEHVDQRLAGNTPNAPDSRDPWILNPAYLSPQRGAQVCQQCHLQGTTRVLHESAEWDDYSPRIPLEQYLSVYTLHSADDEIEVASQAERLAKSACREQDGSTLRCERCHDPHHAKRIDQSEACRHCHAETQIKKHHQTNVSGACPDCHMAKGPTTDAPHVRFRDHWIRKTLTQLTKTKKAEDASRFETLLDDHRSPNQSRVRRGMALVLTGLRGNERRHMLPSALKTLASALRQYPEHAEAWRILGRGYFAIDNPMASIRAYNNYAKLEPDAVLYREFQAQALSRAGRFDEAETSLKQGLSKRPDHGVFHGLLGALLYQRQRFEDAERVFKQAMIHLPDDSTIVFNRAMNALGRKHIDKARQYFEKALELDPLNGSASIQLARLAATRRDLAEAEAILNRARNRNPVAYDVQLELARFYRLNEPLKARRLYEKLRKRWPAKTELQAEAVRFLAPTKPSTPPSTNLP